MHCEVPAQADTGLRVPEPAQENTGLAEHFVGEVKILADEPGAEKQAEFNCEVKQVHRQFKQEQFGR